MPALLGLTIKTDINSLLVGERIPCRYTALTSGASGYFSELGTCTAAEIPLTGSATPNGLFYFIKTDKGTLIADRVIQINISWDILNAAKYIEGDRNSASPTSLLLHMNDILFKEELNHTIINNAVSLSTSTYMFNSSAYFNGNGNYLSIPHENNFDFGKNGDFTIDFWINPTDFSQTINGIMSTVYNSQVISGFSIYFDTSGNLKVNSTSNGSSWELSGLILLNGVNSNEWTHIAIVKSGANLFAFKNGIKGNVLTMTKTFINTNNLLIGTLGILNPWYFKGYIDEFRISNIARWTSNFAPPLSEDILELPMHKVRSLSGGCAYADTNGNMSLTDKSLGAWPTNNEWDKYIVNSDLKGKIIKGDDNIWHYKSLYSWCKETPINGTWNDGLGHTSIISNTYRVHRGYNNATSWSDVDIVVSSTVSATGGFRPILNYVESDIQSEVIY